jgi:hypothetical protein
MDIVALRRFLLCCTLINYGVLIVWFLAFVAAHEKLFHLHGRWFHLTHEQFDALHYAGISIYKIGILLFNLTPLLALYIAP